MNGAARCPSCQAILDTRVLGGLCPRCVSGWMLADSPPAPLAGGVTAPGLPASRLGDYELLAELGAGFVAESLLGLLAQGWMLVPRGALITASLRLLFSDLFVHGLGGGRYDAATDQLIRAWWHEEPAAFAVASASKCLFPEDQDRLHPRRRHRDYQKS